MIFDSMSYADRYREELKPAVSLGIGASLDFVAGRVRRAPRWVSSAGFEWLFRLVQEPGRLLRRYATSNARFAFLVAAEWLRRRRRAPRKPRGAGPAGDRAAG